MYELVVTKDFDEHYTKVTKGNLQLQKKVNKTLQLLRHNPFYPSLKTHKAQAKHYGEKWSSWVTGDVRIIWDFDEQEKLTILLLTIGSHSGSHKIYS